MSSKSGENSRAWTNGCQGFSTSAITVRFISLSRITGRSVGTRQYQNAGVLELLSSLWPYTTMMFPQVQWIWFGRRRILESTFEKGIRDNSPYAKRYIR